MVELTRGYEFGGWRECVRLANDEVELVVTTDVGPRIMRYAFLGGRNALYEDTKDLGKRGGTEFRGYGGHRLWHAPEHPVRTYAPDNAPVDVEWNAPLLALTAPVEAKTGIEKRIEILLAEEGSEVVVMHRLTNRGLWAIELSAWALTQFPSGGMAIFPHEKYIPFPQKLTPMRPLVLWSYTRMNDPRVTWGSRYTLLRADPGAEQPFKVGALSMAAWGAYLRNELLFVKRFPCDEYARYPDFGCNFETFTNSAMIELESLSPVVRLEPGDHLDHVERWRLFDGIPAPKSEEEIERSIEACARARY